MYLFLWIFSIEYERYPLLSSLLKQKFTWSNVLPPHLYIKFFLFELTGSRMQIDKEQYKNKWKDDMNFPECVALCTFGEFLNDKTLESFGRYRHDYKRRALQYQEEEQQNVKGIHDLHGIFIVGRDWIEICLLDNWFISC